MEGTIIPILEKRKLTFRKRFSTVPKVTWHLGKKERREGEKEGGKEGGKKERRKG